MTNLRTQDFERAYRRGRRRKSDCFLVIGQRRPGETSRTGISVRARLGGAVLRNRIKRRLREILRRQQRQLPPGWVVVVEPRTAQVATRNFDRLSAELEEVLRDLLAEEKKE